MHGVYTNIWVGNVNSPQAAPEAHTHRSIEHTIYQQSIENQASGIIIDDSYKQRQQHMASMSHLQNGVGAESDSTEQKPCSNINTINDEQSIGVALPEEPCTPKKKRIPILWHGLPSPETPSFGHDMQSIPSAGSAQEELVWQTSLQRTKGAAKTALEKSKDSGDSLPLLKQLRTDTRTDDVDDGKFAIPQKPENTIQNDAILARELEASSNPTTTRRSTRLRTQPKPTCKSSVC
jgi:hypothetical protein